MTAIVTGSAGFIGSRLMERLPSAFGIDRATGPSVQQVDALPGSCEVIYHLASPVGPVGVLGWAGRLASEVIECADIVASWARMYGCPLVFVSTSEVYGSGVESHESDDCHFGPEPSARQEYALAKLTAEVMLRNTAGLDVRIARPFNVAGPGQLGDGGFVLPRFISQALAGEPLTVYPPGTQLRAFTHVDDVVDGLLLT
ncbi:MAG TPA: NAD-dependent epimerase/dehydratase family protein, partial [Candidatus Limnocylindrales bacterium]